MKRILIAAAMAGVLAASIVSAQNQDSATTRALPEASAEPPAISTTKAASKTMAAPVAGKNSFTYGEVVKRLGAYGYADVDALVKDRNGIWRGTAKKNGKQVDVALDYQGNIVEQ